MNSAIARLSLVCATCAMFLFFVNTASFSRVVELFDTAESLDDFLDDPGHWDETKGGVKLDNRDKYNDTPSLLIPGPSGVGVDGGWLERRGKIPRLAQIPDGEPTAPRGGGVHILDDPKKANEYRYLTFAVKVDPPGNFAVIKFLGFPGFHFNTFHQDACWDHLLILGDASEGANWNVNTRSHVIIDGQDYITSSSDSGQRNLSEWTHYIVDLPEWSREECEYNDDCKEGKWNLNAPSFEAACAE